MRMIMVIIIVIINSSSFFTLGSSGSKGSWLSSSCPSSSWSCAIRNNLWNRAFHNMRRVTGNGMTHTMSWRCSCGGQGW